MIGYDQKIQRGLELHARPVIRVDYRLALGESVCRVRVGSEIVVEKGIEGIGGVQVRVAPEKLSFLRGNARMQHHEDTQDGGGRSHEAHSHLLDRPNPE